MFLRPHDPSGHCHVFPRSVFEVGVTCHWAKVLISARRWFPWGVRSGASNGSRNIFSKFRKVGQAVTLTFRTPLESHQNGHIPLRECPHFFQRTQIRATKLRFMHAFFTYSLRCECESNQRVTHETDPNLVDFWRGSWLPIMRHADHDGAIRLLR